MDNTLIFIFGFVAFLMAIGPLAVAAYLDARDKRT